MIDLALVRVVVGLRQRWLDEAMLAATALGAAGFLWLVVAAVGSVWPERRAAAWRLLLAVACTSLIVDGVMKPLVNRPRPYDADAAITRLDARQSTSSFPSGHAARAVAGALAAGRVFPAGAWAFWPAALAVSASRVYLGAHWPSDVAAGAAVGLACAWFVLGGRAARSGRSRRT